MAKGKKGKNKSIPPKLAPTRKQKQAVTTHKDLHLHNERIFIFKHFDSGFPKYRNNRDMGIAKLLDKLKAFEVLKSQELGGRGSHRIDPAKVPIKARRRLEEIKMDDYNVLYSFNIEGGKRLFSLVNGKYELVIWWDPGHLVIPVKKKHT